MSKSRQLAAIMFTDIVGFTALMGSDEKKTLEILEKNRQIHKPIISEYNGQWIKELGDGVMATFPTVSDAVNAATKIMGACDAANEYQLSMGIHSAEVVFENDDVFGDGVNIAARIESVAPPGCILVSESVHRNIVNKKDIQTHFVKEAELKNVSHPIRLYQVLTDSGQLLKSEDKIVTLVENSIAVLPFVNMSKDPDQEYFSDGISEEIINMLAQEAGMKVIGRTSSFAFKGKNMDLKLIGEQLNVSHILEGSIRKSGNKLRITAQLIKVADGFHLYSEKFDRELEDIFDIQDEISLAILKATKSILFGLDKEPVLKKYTDNVEAYQHYLKGRYHFNRYEFPEALASYQAAIEIDGAYAIAYARMASCYYDLAFLGMDSEHDLAQAVAAAQKGMELDDQNSDCLYAMGKLKSWYEWDFEAAINLLERATRLNPNNADAFQQLGIRQMSLKKFDQGERNLKKALSLDPFSLTGMIYIAGAGYWPAQQWDKVLELTNRISTMNPNIAFAHNTAGIAHLGLHQFEKAREEFELAVELKGDIMNYGHLACFYAFVGETDKSRELLEKMRNLTDGRLKGVFSNFGFVHAFLGEWDRAFELFDLAVEGHEGNILLLQGWIPIAFPKIKDDPRFAALAERIGLPF